MHLQWERFRNTICQSIDAETKQTQSVKTKSVLESVEPEANDVTKAKDSDENIEHTFSCYWMKIQSKIKLTWKLELAFELKMMLLKCCTQYISKFGKLNSGHRVGKGQSSFQFQRKAMPKNI